MGGSCANGTCVPPETVHVPYLWLQTRPGGGAVSAEVELEFTGLRAVPGVTSASDLLLWGYADVDLPSLYGWPWEDVLRPGTASDAPAPEVHEHRWCAAVAGSGEPLCQVRGA